MKRHLALLIAATMLAASVAVAVSPRQDYSTDVSKSMTRRGLIMAQNSTQVLGWRFTQGASSGVDITDGIVTFVYAVPSRGGFVTVTGRLDNATNGSVVVDIPPSKLNTNGTYDFRLQVSDATSTMAYAYGDLTIVEDPSATGTLLIDTGTNSLNWAAYTNYSNTGTSGPYRAGTNISFRANTDGSVTIDADRKSVTAVTMNAVTNMPDVNGVVDLGTVVAVEQDTNALATLTLHTNETTTAHGGIVPASDMSAQWTTNAQILAAIAGNALTGSQHTAQIAGVNITNAQIAAASSTWNTAATDATDATNRVKTIEDMTQTWNAAASTAIDATQRIEAVELNTQLWNTAATDATTLTGRVFVTATGVGIGGPGATNLDIYQAGGNPAIRLTDPRSSGSWTPGTQVGGIQFAVGSGVQAELRAVTESSDGTQLGLSYANPAGSEQVRLSATSIFQRVQLLDALATNQAPTLAQVNAIAAGTNAGSWHLNGDNAPAATMNGGGQAITNLASIRGPTYGYYDLAGNFIYDRTGGVDYKVLDLHFRRAYSYLTDDLMFDWSTAGLVDFQGNEIRTTGYLTGKVKNGSATNDPANVQQWQATNSTLQAQITDAVLTNEEQRAFLVRLNASQLTAGDGLTGGGYVSNNPTLSIDETWLATHLNATNVFSELYVADITSTGAQMVVNGGFTNTAGWTNSGFVYISPPGVMVLLHASAASGYLAPSNAIAAVSNRMYLVSYSFFNASPLFEISLAFGGVTNAYSTTVQNSGPYTTRSFIVPARNTASLRIDASMTGGYVYLDDISIKPITGGSEWANTISAENVLILTTPTDPRSAVTKAMFDAAILNGSNVAAWSSFPMNQTANGSGYTFTNLGPGTTPSSSVRLDQLTDATNTITDALAVNVAATTDISNRWEALFPVDVGDPLPAPTSSQIANTRRFRIEHDNDTSGRFQVWNSVNSNRWEFGESQNDGDDVSYGRDFTPFGTFGLTWIQFVEPFGPTYISHKIFNATTNGFVDWHSNVFVNVRVAAATNGTDPVALAQMQASTNALTIAMTNADAILQTNVAVRVSTATYDAGTNALQGNINGKVAVTTFSALTNSIRETNDHFTATDASLLTNANARLPTLTYNSLTNVIRATNDLFTASSTSLGSTNDAQNGLIAGLQLTNALAVTNVINGGTSGSTGVVTRSGQAVTITFPISAAAETNQLWDSVNAAHATNSAQAGLIAGLQLTNGFVITNLIPFNAPVTNGSIAITGNTAYVTFPMAIQTFGGTITNGSGDILTNYWTWTNPYTNWAIGYLATNTIALSLQYLVSETGNDTWDIDYDSGTLAIPAVTTAVPVSVNHYVDTAALGDADTHTMLFRNLAYVGTPSVYIDAARTNATWGPVTIPALPPRTESRNTITAFKYSFTYMLTKSNTVYRFYWKDQKFMLYGSLTPN
jgi:hypothetical protein